MQFPSNKKVFSFLVIVAICGALIASFAQASGTTTTEEGIVNPKITIWASIYNIDQETKTSDIGVFVKVDDLPYNNTHLLVMLSGGDQPFTIDCMPDGQQTNGLWKYHGLANQTCVLDGSGDVFPFDTYTLTLVVDLVEGTNIINVSINTNTTTALGSNAFFTGPHQYALKNSWKASINGEPSLAITERKMVITLDRSDNSFKYDFLIFLLPILAIYYFFGASLLIDPKTHFNERLTMYVSLLFFVPVFLISIQTLIPYRTSISFPEILLINLIISSAIMTVCSIVGKYKASMNRDPCAKPELRWDMFGVAAALVCLFLLYVYAVPQIPLQPSFIFVYGIVPAYVFWSLAKIQTGVSSREQALKTIRSFVIGLTISLIFYLFSLFSGSVGVQLSLTFSGSFLAGLLFGFTVRNLRISVFLGFISGILWSIILGAYIGSIFNGFAGAISGIISLGLLGGIYAPFSAFGGLIGSKLSTWLNKRREAI